MKRIVVIITVLLVLFFIFECEKTKKPTHPELEDPSYYFPINLYYKWTYVDLGPGCMAWKDSLAITAANRNTRLEGSGWDLVSSKGDTSFVYRIGDTIFYKINVLDLNPAYKNLVGPIKGGTFWKDRYPYTFEYSIVGFEDIYSSIAGVTYRGCAKIRRTAPDDAKTKYFWWAPQYGKVKEAEYIQSGDTLNCQQGEELKRLDKTPEFP